MPLETNRAYFADKTHVSHSMLKDFMVHPYLFKLKHVDLVPDAEPTDAMRLGTAMDVLLTEGREEFSQRYEVVKRRTSGQEDSQLTEGASQAIEAAAEEWASQTLAPKLTDYDSRQSILRGTLHGVKVKAKLDFYSKGLRSIRDLKYVGDLARFEPARYATQLEFYRALALAVDGIDCSTGLDVLDHEGRYQHFAPTAQTLGDAAVKIEAALKELKESLDMGVFREPTRQEALSIPELAPYYKYLPCRVQRVATEF